MLDETDIQKLLRLKRYEQPPVGYHEKFLQDFHRRQRAELLRQPAWKIALERLETFLSEHSLGRYAYSGATAAVLLVAGVLSFNIVNNSAPALVKTQGAPQALVMNSTAPSNPIAPIAENINIHPQTATASAQTTHYVIDSRPVSYERPFSF